MGARRQLQGVARVRARRTQVRSGPGALLPPLVDDGLRPEHHAEDHEDRPLERVGPAERVAALRPVELPVTEPEHAPAGGDRERVPGQPPGADQETPTRVRLAACHAPSLVRLRPVAVWRIPGYRVMRHTLLMPESAVARSNLVSGRVSTWV